METCLLRHRVMANHAKLAGNVTSSIALLTWRSWEMGLIFNHLQSAMGLTSNFVQFRCRRSLAMFSRPSYALNDNVMLNKRHHLGFDQVMLT